MSFSYTPEAPRAGQAVTFSNLSSGGEEWAWTFGDGGTSTTKSPVYTYKNPGTYIVTLKVDGKNSLTHTAEITVYDTIPTFVASDSTFVIFQNYTFTANIYNPYSYDVEYQWMLPINSPYAQVLDSSMNKSTLHLYFMQAIEAPIWLTIIMNGDTTKVEKTFKVEDRATNSVLFRNSEGDYRQRIFGALAEYEKKDNTATPYLDSEQDTAQLYNGYLFLLSELQKTFPNLLGFKIANRKIYYRANGNGLWVAAIDGSNPVQIESADCPAMTLDLHDNRIYWALADEVKYMPLIGSDNNQFVTQPKTINHLTGVTKIAVDN